MSMASSELTDSTTDKKTMSLQVAAAEAAATASEDMTASSSSFTPSPYIAATVPDTTRYTVAKDHHDASHPVVAIRPEASYAASGSIQPAHIQEGAHLEVNHSIVAISKDTAEDTQEEPWIVEKTNMTEPFKTYQETIRSMVDRHTTLPLESYIHELAALTHVLVICKNQHSGITENIFSLELLKRLAASLASDLLCNVNFEQEFTRLSTSTSPSSGTPPRQTVNL
ncbi:hypothetical protein EC973_000123 [Apophysomyces ossiformis]|uniref:Uncharacterized protein n=1 Tax=Apophysomyces ossiformis TaxID=679940 RepID=A0A8H7ETJ2_9FUNG|nr:hypothetical protein EC973_000123 [Apophysomyces ossiformis]